MGLVQLTRKGGQAVLVNIAHVSHVLDKAGDKLTVLVMSNGQDFEVAESFEDVMAAFGAS